MTLSDKELEAVVESHARAIQSELYEGQRPRWENEAGKTEFADVDWRKISAAAARIHEIAVSKFA